MIRYVRPLTLVLFLSLVSILTNAQSTEIQTPCTKSAPTTSAPCQSLEYQSRIDFQGLNSFPISDVLKSFREHGLMRADATPTEKNINEAAKLLKALLADKGYMDASVVGLRIGESNAVRFVVDEGMKYAITSLEFVGNKHFTTEDLAGHLREYLNEDESETRPGYDRDILDYGLHQLSSYMRSQGYLQAQLREPRISVIGAGLKVTVSTTEGPLCRLGNLKLDGVKAMSLEEVRSLLPMTKGDIANGEKIGKWIFEDLKRLYGEKGFVEYTAEPVPLFKNNPRNPEEEVVDFAVQIDEGKQFSLRSLTFEGEDLSQKQLAEFFVLNVGDVFNQRLLQESVARINKAGLFEPIDVDRDFTYKTDEENGTVALALNLRKKTASDKQ